MSNAFDSETDFTDNLKLLEILGTDVDEYAEEMDQNDTARSRRSYVRAVFAYIEGACLVMRRYVIARLRDEPLSWDTLSKIMVAAESQFDLSRQGEIRERKLKLNTQDLLLFSLQEFSQVMGTRLNLSRTCGQWDSYRKAVGIRNKLMHPKSPQDLLLCDEEIESVKEALGLVHLYFFTATNEEFREILEEKKKEHKATGKEIKFVLDEEDLNRLETGSEDSSDDRDDVSSAGEEV